MQDEGDELSQNMSDRKTEMHFLCNSPGYVKQRFSKVLNCMDDDNLRQQEEMNDNTGEPLVQYEDADSG